ncbi:MULTISPECIES: MarR family transcriptional regulator [unclassified Enterococcus]|uniref:MarR family winged helix-turn-helix transcriptional regulator n=1 Tax=unclassified Enterococcus TaxID=2608891 RepID=UPI00155467BF|nr:MULTISPECIES: MarR family transcriptional regulator [unclassified Enterococcus]MBS7576456.1 MarR family transcriptional regulator [Enterococcus sp. MMGLQ5-2]MBS7583688.1 MarR family transcriptional regulator [Enterococcus sp. MMGLQ5-1]NPD11549.1 MarR family transcriptional regulator [Enterococcus sp. MMGLQ5-1]NPD36293.1 MarR family transcriptional regulator [Enterococcus sp. MMGLQ5-2]
MSKLTHDLLRSLASVGRLSQKLAFNAEMKQTAPAQQRIIDLLSEEDGLTQGLLAELLDIKPSSLAETLKKLEQKGVINRREDKDDKRIKQVFLTEAGKLKASTGKQLDYSEALFKGLTVAEQEALQQLLTKMIAGFPENLKTRFDKATNPFEKLASIKTELFEEFSSEAFQALPRHEQEMLKREKLRACHKAMHQNFGRPHHEHHHDRGHFGRENFFDARFNSDFTSHEHFKTHNHSPKNEATENEY